MSKLDDLRSGLAVEVEPGVSARLNKNNRTLELSSGKVLDVSDDPHYFPSSEQDQRVAKKQELIEKDIKGPVGEFWQQFKTKGLLGSANDWLQYATQPKQEYLETKQAERNVSENISQQSPYTSGAATVASFIPDLALTRGMSAFKAAPLLTAANAGSRLASEPGTVAGEAAIGAGLGKLLDVGGKWLNNAAARRGASRQLPAQQAAVAEQNRIAQESAMSKYLADTQNTKLSNQALTTQYEKDLATRQAQIIKEQNDYNQKVLQRENQIIALKNKAELEKIQRAATAAQSEAEYKAARQLAETENKRMAERFKREQALYEEDLKKLPDLQKRAQAEYSYNVVRNAEAIQRSFPKNTRINSDDLNISSFIENSIEKSGLAGSREASQARRILTSLFPEGEYLTGKALSSRYRALEDAIQRSPKEVQSVLSDFKLHIGERLPVILEDSLVHSNIVSYLKKNISNDIKNVISDIGLPKGSILPTELARKANKEVSTLLTKGASTKDFVQKLQNGDFSREMASKLLSPEDFILESPVPLNALKKNDMFKALYEEGQRRHAFFVNTLANKLDSKLARQEIKAIDQAKKSSRLLKKEMKGTFGLAEEVQKPVMPEQPTAVSLPQPPTAVAGHSQPLQLPQAVPKPIMPAMPQKPNLAPMPAKPNVSPIPEPILPPAQGTAEAMGDFFENNKLLGGNTLVNNPLTKLAGLKYLLGKAALPMEAAYLGAKGLTSPTAGGELARMAFSKGGIAAIDSWAQEYPSYHDGILDSPQDRRSLTKQIEDAQDIPIEQKALLQSKVNRGKPLSPMGLLRE